MKNVKLNWTGAGLLVAMLLLAAAPSAFAFQPYYWDGNNGTAGFGTASGTWAAPTTGTATAGWSTDSTGATVVLGNSVTTTTGDPLNFGTSSAALATGSITVSGTVDAGDIFYGSGTGVITLTGGTINLAATQTLTTNSVVGTVHLIASTLSGAGTSLTKDGVGALALTQTTTTFNPGQIIVNNGVFRIGNATSTQLNAGSYSGNISIASGATLQLWTNSAQTLSGIISGAGALHKAYGGALTLSGANTYTGKSSFVPQTTAGFTVNVSSFNSVNGGTPLLSSSSLGAPTTVANGTIDVGSGSAAATVTLNYTGSGETTDRVLNISFNAGDTPTISNSGTGLLKFTSAPTVAVSSGTNTLILSGSNNGEFTQAIPQLPAAGLSKAGAGTWTFSGANTYTGPTKVTAGTLVLANSLGLQNSPLDTTNSIAGTASAGLKTTVTTFQLGGITGTKDLASVFTTTSGGYSGVTALTLNNASGTTSTYSGVIADGASGMTLSKTGFGTQFLNGINSYTGLTTVSAGTLGGSGTITTAVSFASGTALSPGASAGAIGTLTLSNNTSSALTLNGINLLCDLPSSGTVCDLVAVTGDLVLNGTNTVTLNVPAGGIAASTNFDLITYANKTGSGSLVFVNGLSTLGNLTLVANATTNAQLQVSAGGLNNCVWSGASGAWDGGATNWTRNGTATQAFVDGDFVAFDDNGSTLTVTSTGTVSPTSVTVNNSTKAYIINATIGGTGTPLIKSGTNSLTLGGTNTYPGGTILNAGTLATTADANLGNTSGGITVNGTATWNMGAATAVTYNRSLSVNDGAVLSLSSGNAAKTVTGMLAGNGALIGTATTSYVFSNTGNTFTGAVTPGYEIRFTSLADSSNPINLGGNTGGFTWTGGTKTFSSRPFTLSTTGTSIISNNGTGALTIGSNIASSGAAGARTLQLGFSGTTGVPAGYTASSNIFSGNITDGAGSVVSLQMAGASSTWTLSGTNTYSGQTTVTANGITLVFAGVQSVSPNTTFLTNTNASSGASTIKLLDDTGGVNNSTVTLPNTFTIQNNNTPGNTHTFFVGNNNTANGGTSSGTTTGGTIAIGTLNYGTMAAGTNNVGQFPIQGTNGYRLQINNVILFNASSSTAGTPNNNTFTPTTANVTLGTVTMATGNNGLGVPFLVLDGTSSDNRVSGNISDAADALTTGRPLNVTKSNTSTWALDGTGNTFTGTILLNGTTTSAGTLSYASASGTNPITFNATTGFNSTLSYTGASPLTMSGLMTASALTTGGITIDASGSTPTATINYSNASNFSSASAGTSTKFITFSGSNTGDNTFAGAISNNTGAGGNTQVAKTGAGKWVFTGSSNYTGGLFVNQGTISVPSIPNGGVNSPLGANTRINLGSASGDGTLIFTGSGSTTNRDVRIGNPTASATGSGVIQNDGTGALTFTASTFNPTLAGITVNRTLTLGGSYTGGVNEIQGVIQNNTASTGLVGLTKTGAGTWTLSGANTYGNGTTVSGGQLNINNAAAIGTGALTMAGGNIDNTSAADITLSNNNAQNWNADFTYVGSVRNLNMGTGAVTLNASRNITVSTNTLTVGGAIGESSAGQGLTKSGTGTLTLTGTSTYTGQTLVSSGTLAGMATLSSALVVTGGTLAPGLSGTTGTFTAASADFSGGGTLLIQAKSSAGFDKLVVTGNLKVQGGNLTVDLTGFSGSSAEYVIAEANTWDTGAGFATTISNYSGPGVVKVSYYNNTVLGKKQILLSVNSSVSPVKIADFKADVRGAGVIVSFDAVSEYKNAGFNIYRRSIDGGEWVRANDAMINGRVTNPDEKSYSFYDWAPAGEWVYKLESIDVSGFKETYEQFAGPVAVDWNARLVGIASVDLDSVVSMVDGLAVSAGVKNAEIVGTKFAAIEKDAGERVPRSSTLLLAEARSSNPSANEIAGLDLQQQGVRALVATARDISAVPSASTARHSAGVRWFTTSAAGGAEAAFSSAKVLHAKSGVLIIPQAMLPAGYDVNHVSIQREGRNVGALAQVAGGLLVYAPGYQDEYTDKDAFFLRRISGATAAGSFQTATNLFSSSLPVNVTSKANATAEYHDVYFDFNYRPYNFAPWFSGQYLTSGTTQSFTLNTPAASGGAATLTVNLWSLTDEPTVNPDHQLQVVINGTAVGTTQSWDGGNKAMQIVLSVPGGVLNAGSNRIDLVTPTINGVSSQIAFLHSLSVDYTRNLDGASAFEITNSTTGSQLFELYNVANPTTWVVDTRFTDRAALVPIQTQLDANGTYRLRFVASAGGSGKYMIVPSGQENSPLNVSVRTVRPVRLTGTFLTTGPSQFSAGVQPLLSMHAKEGIKGQFVDQEQMFDYYNFGRFGPSAIQKAVRATQPQYLMLLGRTTYDYRNYTGASVDPMCPTFLVATSFWAQSTSDSMFGDLGRGYPEVAVGRLPVNDANDLNVAVSHITHYKGAPISGVRAHAVADAVDSEVANFGQQLAALAAGHAEMTWQSNTLGVTYGTSAAVNAAMTDAANGGADLIVYNGHGNSARLGKVAPRILDTTLVQSWHGNVVFLQSTCTANWAANNVTGWKSIAMQALTQPQGGISASIGTSTYMNPDVAMAFTDQLLKNANRSGARWGRALMQTQQWALRQSGGFYTDVGNTEQIFGDPAMNVYSAAVRNTTTTGAVNGNTPVQPGTF